jgi:hypothetical protein
MSAAINWRHSSVSKRSDFGFLAKAARLRVVSEERTDAGRRKRIANLCWRKGLSVEMPEQNG